MITEPMSESEFDSRAERTLLAVLEAVAGSEDERVDVELESGVLTITFDDGARFVVNSHRAARQIWVAANASAWHLAWDGKAWISTKTQEELFALLERCLGSRLGRPFSLRR